ncbi:MAG: 4a-hydroxytetrahydrobiopterin dehydratase [Candidatus Omnitrophica bacterium]|nr:4a-hydroxytetrahydrobiopterin dehydratase [Candidatus Omnitrophota bacterium]
MVDDFLKKRCKPCEGGAAPIQVSRAKDYLKSLSGWQLAETAEAEDHHPDLHLTDYRKFRIELSTHAIGGLSENDYILAAKIERIPKELKG